MIKTLSIALLLLVAFGCEKQNNVSTERIPFTIELTNIDTVEFEYWSLSHGFDGYKADVPITYTLKDTLRFGEHFTLHFRGYGVVSYKVKVFGNVWHKGIVTPFETKTVKF